MYPNIDEPKDLVNGLASSSTNTSCHFECLFHSLSDNVSRKQTALRCEKRRAKSNSKTGYLRPSNYQNRSNLAISLFWQVVLIVFIYNLVLRT
jgi:hypothetical protein